MSLRRKVRQVQKSSAYAHCTVEAIVLGYATIRLATNGARLTNLPVVGGELSVGDIAIVDYSAGTPPVVRPISVDTGATSQSLEEVDATYVGATEDVLVPEDTSAYIYGITAATSTIAANNWHEVNWSSSRYDTHSFLQNGQIVIPTSGYYYVIAHISLTGFLNYKPFTCYGHGGAPGGNSANLLIAYKDRVYVELSASTYGVFAFQQDFPVVTEYLQPCMVECIGMVPANAGDIISAKIYHTSGGGPISITENGELYPRIMVVKMSPMAVNVDIPDNPFIEADDADIELRRNEGYLHVTGDEESYARAIAHVTDTSNIEVTLDFYFEDIDHGATFRVFLRASRDWNDWQTPTKAYEFSYSNTGTIQLWRIESGARTLLDDISFGSSTSAMKLRFRCNSNDIQVRVWADADTEPSTWLLDVDDSVSGFTTAGTLQLGYFTTNGDHKMYIDNVSVHAPA